MRNGQIKIHLIDLGGDVGEVKLVEWHVASGTHGIEGFFGSAVQTGALEMEFASGWKRPDSSEPNSTAPNAKRC